MGILAFALAAISLAKRRPLVRTGTALAFALAGFGFSTLLRNEGMTGEYTWARIGDGRKRRKL